MKDSPVIINHVFVFMMWETICKCNSYIKCKHTFWMNWQTLTKKSVNNWSRYDKLISAFTYPTCHDTNFLCCLHHQILYTVLEKYGSVYGPILVVFQLMYVHRLPFIVMSTYKALWHFNDANVLNCLW